MNQKKSSGKKLLIGCGIAAGSVVFIFIVAMIIAAIFMPSDYAENRKRERAQKKREKDSLKNIQVKEDTTTTTVVTETPIVTESRQTKLSEQDCINIFQAQWDSVKLMNNGGFPQFEDYFYQLSDIVINMNKVIKQDSVSYLKLGKLKTKFFDSKKFNEAEQNYFTYGQPYGDYELEGACKNYIKQNAHDPGSIKIEASQVKGRSKKGWVVVVKYRGKNAFGAKVVNTDKFEVCFSDGQRYFVCN